MGGAEVEPTEDLWSAAVPLSGLLGATDSPFPEWLATHHTPSALAERGWGMGEGVMGVFKRVNS